MSWRTPAHREPSPKTGFYTCFTLANTASARTALDENSCSVLCHTRPVSGKGQIRIRFGEKTPYRFDGITKCQRGSAAFDQVPRSRTVRTTFCCINPPTFATVSQFERFVPAEQLPPVQLKTHISNDTRPQART